MPRVNPAVGTLLCAAVAKIDIEVVIAEGRAGGAAAATAKKVNPPSGLQAGQAGTAQLPARRSRRLAATRSRHLSPFLRSQLARVPLNPSLASATNKSEFYCGSNGSGEVVCCVKSTMFIMKVLSNSSLVLSVCR